MVSEIKKQNKGFFFKNLIFFRPTLDFVVVFLSVIVISCLVYLALTIINQPWANTVIYGWFGQFGVCVVFPLYWMIIVKKKKMSSLGITKKYWLISVTVGFFIALFMFLGYQQKNEVTADILPAVLLGLLGLWEIFFCFGWLQLRFEQSFGIIPGIILAALGYASYHFGYPGIPLASMTSFFVLGMVYATIFRTTKNLLILLPAWPIACLYGFKTAGIVVSWGHALRAIIILPFMIMAIIVFYLIQKKYQKINQQI